MERLDIPSTNLVHRRQMMESVCEFLRLSIASLLHHMSNSVAQLYHDNYRHAKLEKLCSPLVVVLGQYNPLESEFVDLRIQSVFLYYPQFC